MNILVCIKQVPDTQEIKIDPETNTLIREGVPSIVNPFDVYGLEVAARIKDMNTNTKIIVVSMGPEQTKNALRECLGIAADKAYLVSSRLFGGSDTLATSYILSNAIKKIEELEGKFDAIFCGKQAIDGDTAQVGPEIAEHLGYPQITYGLEAEEIQNGLKVLKETEDGKQVITIQNPCVITFTKPAWEPRYATIKRKLASIRAEITVLSDIDFPGIDKAKIGLKGSPTKVKKTFVPARNTNGILINEKSASGCAIKLLDLLSEANMI